MGYGGDATVRRRTTSQAIGQAIKRAAALGRQHDRRVCASRSRVGVEGGSGSNGGAVCSETSDVVGVMTGSGQQAGSRILCEFGDRDAQHGSVNRRASIVVGGTSPPFLRGAAVEEWDGADDAIGANECWSSATRTKYGRLAQRLAGGCGVAPGMDGREKRREPPSRRGSCQHAL